MSDLSKCRAIVIVFSMEGCPYCDEYQPRFEQQLGRFLEAGTPLVHYSGGALAPHAIPVIFLDGASTDPQISALADQHQVEGMPTTLLLRRYRAPVKLEGAASEREIYDLLVAACHA